MRWKPAWKSLTLLVVGLAMIGVLEAHIELNSGDTMRYVEGAAGIPQVQLSADGQTPMFVNACQTYAFATFYFVGLMAAHNLVQLRTPMLLTRYRTWRAFQRATFVQLMRFSAGFLVVTTGLLMTMEQIIPYTAFKHELFVANICSAKALIWYTIHMLLCTAMVCLYQTAVVLTKHHVLSQALPMLFFIGSGSSIGTFVQQLSPFSFPVYDRIPEGGLVRVIATYAVCFVILLFVCRRPKKEYIAGVIA